MNAPVFLLSSERSGSNLIRLMFDSHPRFCAPPPPHLFHTFLPLLSLYGPLQDHDNFARLTRDMVDFLGMQLGRWEYEPSAPELIRSVQPRSFPALVLALYQREARLHGKQRVLVKDNGNIPFAFRLLAAYPEARFVHLVRDPRDMALSWKRSHSHPGGVRRAATVWAEEQLTALDFHAMAQDRVRIVHYETLVSRPLETLQELCSFLGEPFEERMLAFHKGAQAENSADSTADWSNLRRPLMHANFGKYKKSLTRRQIHRVECAALRPMAMLGYIPETSARPRSGRLRSAFKAARIMLGLARLAAASKDGRRESRARFRRLRALQRLRADAAIRPAQWSAPELEPRANDSEPDQ
jgi:hypothetical protein